MGMRSKPKNVTPFGVKEQTRSNFYKNRGILGLIVTYYLLFFVYFIAYLLSFASIGVAFMDLFTNYNMTGFNGFTFVTVPIIALMVVISLLSYMFQTLVYQVLLDFIRTPEKYSKYSFVNFILEPFKKFNIMTAIYIFILNLIKYIIIFVVNGLLIFTYGIISYVLMNVSLSLIFILSIFYPILFIIINIKLYLTFSQINVAIADYQLSDKKKNIFDVFSSAYRMMENQGATYFFLMLSFLKWFIVIILVMAFTLTFVVSTVIISYVTIASVILMIVLIHFYVPYIALAQVTFYDEVMSLRNFKL